MRRERRRVTAAEQVGPYTLLAVERGGLEAGDPGQFFMLEAPGRLLPRPMSVCRANGRELEFLIDPIGPGTRALCALEPGDELHVLGPLGNGFDLTVERPLLVGGGIGIAPLPFLSQRLGGPPALLGFRSEWHAEAAVLVPNAEVCIEPTYVTELLPGGDVDVLACGPEPMLAALRALAPDAQLAWEAPMACGYGACYGCAVEIDGELKRLCARRTECSVLLNASGCLDALTAPDVARSLDAFVTKTITPEPREGNPPVRIAETDAGMLNSIGLANPGRERFLAEMLPRLRRARRAALDLGRRLLRRGLRRDVRAPSRTLTRSSSISPARTSTRRPRARLQIVAACRAATSLPLYAKLSPAAWDLAEAARAVEAAGADGLSLVNTLRGLALDERTLRPVLARGAGGYSGPALKPVALAAVYACSAAVDAPDRRHGRSTLGSRCAGVDRRRRERRRARHDPLLRPRRAGPDPLGARRRGGRTGPRRSARGARHCPFLPANTRFVDTSAVKSLTTGPKCHCLTAAARMLVSRAHGARRRRRRRRFGPSINGWRRSSGRTTSASGAPS